jgi:demethylmenaquinone methyltransferase / 2-methoxy-6-polyprenyl-1,4-benzoquinol methylase
MSATLVDKRESRIRRMFGDIAPRYDLLNHLLSLNIDRSWRRRTTRLVPPEGDGPILDVCTGTGDLALEYHAAGAGCVPVVGVDFCHPMLEQAKVKAAKRRVSAQFLEADAQALPFPDDSFQITSVAFGLRNVTNTDRGLAEMARVTRPGGRVAILEFSKPRHWLFGRLYRFYFTHFLPRFGQAVARNRDDAYSYLPASVMQFPDYEALLAKMEQHGLKQTRYYPMTFGIATLYVGVKA